MSAEIHVEVGKSHYLPSGEKISPFYKRNIKKPGSSTAYHEVKHAVPALELGVTVHSTSIIPGPGYEGITHISQFNEVAAVAPDADGMDGTGYDMLVASSYGRDIHSAKQVAVGILREKEEHIHALASELEERKTMTGDEMRAVMEDVDLGKEVVVFLEKRDGRKQTITHLRAKRNIVNLSHSLLDREQAA